MRVAFFRLRFLPVVFGVWLSSEASLCGALLAWLFLGLGIILGAWYMLTMFRQVMHGPLDKPANRELKDLSTREIAVLVPIIILIFLIGILPNLFLAKMSTSVAALLTHVAGFRP